MQKRNQSCGGSLKKKGNREAFLLVPSSHQPRARAISSFLVFVCFPAVSWQGRSVELVRTRQVGVAIWGPSRLFKRTARICAGLIAAVFLLQFYWIRELLVVEGIVVLGFVAVAFTICVYALVSTAASWLLRGLSVFALVKRNTSPIRETASTHLSEHKEVSWHAETNQQVPVKNSSGCEVEAARLAV